MFTAEALNQRDRPGLGVLTGKTRLLDQVRGKAAVDDAEHLAHDRRAGFTMKTRKIVSTTVALILTAGLGAAVDALPVTDMGIAPEDSTFSRKECSP